MTDDPRGKKKDIWVLAESRGGEPTLPTLGLIGEARRLGRERAGAKLCALVLGSEERGLGDSLGRYGVERVYCLEDGPSQDCGPDVWSERISDLARGGNPLLLLLAATPLGSDLAARIAAKLGAALASRCVDVRTGADGEMEFVRAVSNEMLYETVRARGEGTRVATMDLEVLEPAEPDGKNRPEVLRLAPPSTGRTGRVRIVERIRGDPKTIPLEEAEIVVAGGRGMAEGRPFPLVEALAEALGGSVGASRPVVDAGLVPFERQIGRTGKEVAPRLLLACGISGASEFTSGIAGAKRILAINLDKDAPIMKRADLAVVADGRLVIEEILRILGERTRHEPRAPNGSSRPER